MNGSFDSVILASIIVLGLLWGVAGGFAWSQLESVEKPRWQDFAFTILCGPVAWAISIYRGWRDWRRSILARFGVEHFDCCGGSHCHSHPRGARNDRAKDYSHGYPADALQNHP